MQTADCLRVFLVLLCQLGRCLGWHEFGNAHFHCWPMTASALHPEIIDCQGIEMRWIEEPGDTIVAEQPFNMTFELIVSDSFYDWAVVDNDYFSIANGTGITNASDAKDWCESDACPVSTKAKEWNCCVWHVNVHSCPLHETENGLCGPWIPPTGHVFTHSDAQVGPIDTGNWTSYVAGLYELGVNSVIAHFKIAGIQAALETKINVISKAVCGDGTCEGENGEDCSVCPADCGTCPLPDYQIVLIVGSACLLIGAGVFVYFQYKKRKLLWDDSWNIPFNKINIDDGLRGAFGSMLGSTLAMTAGSDTHIMALTAARRQVFTKTAVVDGRVCAVKMIRKKEFSVTRDIRCEVKAIRFAFAADISRGMHFLHSRKLFHGRLKSNNCVVDDRWTVKITDFGLHSYRKADKLEDDAGADEDENSLYREKRAAVYIAPELQGLAQLEATPEGDIYAFAILLIEIATRNDPLEDEDPLTLPPGWKPALPDLSADTSAEGGDSCPSPDEYIQLIQSCWQEVPEHRPSFEALKKNIHKINPNKLSPVDLMMALMEKYSKHLESIVAERTKDLVAEKAKTDRLLYNMLPKVVADDLRYGKTVAAETYDACTIYFSDIVGFTTLSSTSTPIQVVALLNKLYSTFDKVIDDHDVYKVETIGDAYMVVSGVPVVTPFHAMEIANMSLELVDACRIFVIPHLPDEQLQIRVGIHSGPACAGVVGVKMPRYCLFGDTVNTASRIESNGEAFKIHVSNSTYLELEKIGGYTLEKRGLIEVKGKGQMLTWWLISREQEGPLPVGGNHADIKRHSNNDVRQSESMTKVTSKSLLDSHNNQNQYDTIRDKTCDVTGMKNQGHRDNDRILTPVELPTSGDDMM